MGSRTVKIGADDDSRVMTGMPSFVPAIPNSNSLYIPSFPLFTFNLDFALKFTWRKVSLFPEDISIYI